MTKRKMVYDPAYQTFCVYCQEEYGDLATLKRHLLEEHPGTYAAQSIAEEK